MRTAISLVWLRAITFYLVTCLAALPSSGQTPPAAATPPLAPAIADSPAHKLLAEVAANYQDLKRYYIEYVITITNDSKRHGLRNVSNTQERLIIASQMVDAQTPPQRHIEMTTSFMQAVLVDNGVTRWAYQPELRQFTKSNADKPLEMPQAGMPITDYSLMLRQRLGVLDTYAGLNAKKSSLKQLADETLTVRGKAVPCAVLELDTPMPGGSKTTRTLWIDRERKIIWREKAQMAMKGNEQRPETQTTRVTDFEIVKVNEPLDAALFTFTPAATDKEVTEFKRPGVMPMRINLTGKPAIPFTAKALSGETFTFSKAPRDQVYLLDFWASWCGPCVAEMPHLQKLHEEFKDKGLRVIGINAEEANIAQAFMQEHRYTFPSLVDTGGAIAREYSVSGIPQVLIIGRDQQIKWHAIGYTKGNEVELRDAVMKVLSNETPAPSAATRSANPPNVFMQAAPLASLTFPNESFRALALKKIAPSYPAEAKQARLEATVEVTVAVNEAGKVISANALSGPASLHEAAVAAAKQWEFKPLIIAEKAVKMTGTILIEFSLQ